MMVTHCLIVSDPWSFAVQASGEQLHWYVGKQGEKLPKVRWATRASGGEMHGALGDHRG